MRLLPQQFVFLALITDDQRFGPVPASGSCANSSDSFYHLVYSS
jgi:hypothetical protein